MARKSIFILGLFMLGIMVSREVHAEIGPLVPISYMESIESDEEVKRLLTPTFVYFEPGMKEIYTIDGKLRVIIYTSDFYPLYTLDRRHGIDGPQSLAVDKEGYVYVAQAPTKEKPRSRISVFNPILRWERDIYFDGFDGADDFEAYRIDIDDNGSIYVAGLGYKGVLVLDKAGNLIDIIKPEEDGKLVRINNVHVENGKSYLVSEEKGRVYIYDRNRSFLFAFGMKGGAPRHLSRPQSVDVDSRGRMYVVDYMRHVVAAYDPDGVPLFEFGGMGWGPGWFQYPKEIAIDNKDRIMVTDIFNNRIQVFRIMTPEEEASLKIRHTARLLQPGFDLKDLMPIGDLDIFGGDGDISWKRKTSPMPSGDTSSFGPRLPEIIKKGPGASIFKKGPGASLYPDELSRDPLNESRTRRLLHLDTLSMNLTEGMLVSGEGTASAE